MIGSRGMNPHVPLYAIDAINFLLLKMKKGNSLKRVYYSDVREHSSCSIHFSAFFYFAKTFIILFAFISTLVVFIQGKALSSK